jgi:tetratricopeptide (TPR) repeat protein
MRGILCGVVGVAGWLAVCGGARAGVYNPGAIEPFPWPRSMSEALSQLGEYRAIAVPNQQVKVQREGYTPQWKLYERQVKQLEAKSADEWTLDDRISLSACYIRQLKFDKAVGVLRGGDQGNFLILLHLAAAHHGLNDLSRARTYQEAALAAWPSAYAGWSRLGLERARRVERYYLTLLKLREREQQLGQKQMEAVDDLFPGCRFVGPSGKYEAGALARKSADALPPDASEIVLQLVLWMPFDDRLYWLLGELENAQGAVDSALLIFNDLNWSREQSNVAELRQHRRVLLEVAGDVEGWKKWQEALLLKPAFNQDVLGTLQSLTLPGLMTPPGIGPASALAGSLAPSYVMEAASRSQGGAPPQSQQSSSPAAAGGWLPNWTHVTVSFVAGALVATLAGLQWREWQRRQQANAAALAAAERLAPPAVVEHQPSDGSFRPQG